MRKLFLLMVFLCLTACSKPDAYDSNGSPVYLKDYAGKWVILNYWASWCKPCYSEMPALNALFESHQENLVVLGINYDQLKRDELAFFQKKWRISFPLIDINLGAQYGITEMAVLPTTVLISPQGKVTEILQGPQTGDDLLQRMGLNATV